MVFIDEDPNAVFIPPGSRMRKLMFQSGFISLANNSVKPSTANLLFHEKVSISSFIPSVDVDE